MGPNASVGRRFSRRRRSRTRHHRTGPRPSGNDGTVRFSPQRKFPLRAFFCSYFSLSNADRKRLELDEDRLLAVMLYNLIAFMIMMRVSKEEIRRKIRRVLGRCHIGLTMSQQVNELLDHIAQLVRRELPRSARRSIRCFRTATTSICDPWEVVCYKNRVSPCTGAPITRATCCSWR